jgi:hypothetical protein
MVMGGQRAGRISFLFAISVTKNVADIVCAGIPLIVQSGQSRAVLSFALEYPA